MKVVILGKKWSFSTNHVQTHAWVQMVGIFLLFTTQIDYGPDWSPKEWPQLKKLRIRKNWLWQNSIKWPGIQMIITCSSFGVWRQMSTFWKGLENFYNLLVLNFCIWIH